MGRKGSLEWWYGPLWCWEEGLDKTFDGSLSEDAISDKVYGVKKGKNPEKLKNPDKRGIKV
jgi:hypothetical protein